MTTANRGAKGQRPAGRAAGRRQDDGLPKHPLQGGFWKLLVGAAVIVGLSAALWFMTPWSRPGAAADWPAGPPEDVRPSEAASIPVNEGLRERIVVVNRDGEEVARFVAEIAETPRQQEIGLMGRTELAPDRGMLFTWDPPRVIAMWMKDTLISLDFLYVRLGGVIVAVAHDVPPCPPEAVRCPSYAAPEPVAHVLEIPGGRARELGLRPGDRLVLGEWLD